MLLISLEVIQPKNTVQPTFSPFLASTPCLTNVVKRPDNFEFSGNIFRSHDGRGAILSHKSTGKWNHLFRNDR
jgi:hypothetical protein